MSSPSSSDDELCIRAALERADRPGAVTLALERYGPEVLSFLRARLHAPVHAEDAFLQFAEDLWMGIETFRWQSSLRAWMFALARNAATRLGMAAYRRREVAWATGYEPLQDTLARIRTATPFYQQTTIKNRMRALREQLDDDQQTLLILRVGKQLSWKELAVVMGEASPDASDEEVERASARMRGRFQAAKRALRALAEDAGILGGSGGA